MSVLQELIICSLGCVVFFGLIVRQNKIDDMKRVKKAFVNKLKNPGRGTAPPTTETVYR